MKRIVCFVVVFIVVITASGCVDESFGGEVQRFETRLLNEVPSIVEIETNIFDSGGIYFGINTHTDFISISEFQDFVIDMDSRLQEFSQGSDLPYYHISVRLFGYVEDEREGRILSWFRNGLDDVTLGYCDYCCGEELGDLSITIPPNRHGISVPLTGIQETIELAFDIWGGER